MHAEPTPLEIVPATEVAWRTAPLIICQGAEARSGRGQRHGGGFGSFPQLASFSALGEEIHAATAGDVFKVRLHRGTGAIEQGDESGCAVEAAEEGFEPVSHRCGDFGRVFHGNDDDVGVGGIAHGLSAERIFFENIEPPEALLKFEGLAQAAGEAVVDGFGAFSDIEVVVGDDDLDRRVEIERERSGLHGLARLGCSVHRRNGVLACGANDQ